MGAWGSGHFDNDDAMDWTYELEKSSSDAVLRSAFAPFAVKRSLFGKTKAPGYIESSKATIALAAAEVVAAINGKPLASLPDNVSVWVSGHPEIDIGLVEAARNAVTRVLADSELKELWSESDDFESWQTAVEDTLRRLS